MTDTFVDAPAEPATSWTTIVAAVLLGIAATLTALSAYQASVADGDASDSYRSANVALADANFFYSQGNQVSAGDQALFVSYATAAQEDQTDLADYLVTLMRPPMAEAIDWWLATDEATTPFDDLEGNPYLVEDYDEGADQLDESERLNAKGNDAASQSDDYQLATVLLALTLFFGGIATLFRRRTVTVSLLLVAAVALAAGAAQLGVAFSA